MVAGAPGALRGGAFRVVQQGGGAHDLQVGAFGCCQVLGHAVDAQDVRKIVHRVGVGVPGAGLFKGWHKSISSILYFPN